MHTIGGGPLSDAAVGHINSEVYLGLVAQPDGAQERGGLRGIIGKAREILPECSFGIVTTSVAGAFIGGLYSEDVSDCSLWNAFLGRKGLAARVGLDGEGEVMSLKGAELREGHRADHMVVAQERVAPDLAVRIALWRSANYGAFEKPDLALFRDLQAIVKADLRLQYQCDCLIREQLGRSLDTVGAGLIVVDSALKIHHKNLVGADLLRESDLLEERQGFVRAANPAAAVRLERSIGEFEAPGADAVSTPLQSRSGEIARLTLSPLMTAPLVSKRQICIIVLGGSPKRSSVDFDQLRALGVSKAEAQLALALLDGKTVAEHANATGIALATARAHLKRLMLRLGVNRQAELVRKLMSN